MSGLQATLTIVDNQIALERCGLYLSHWTAVLHSHHVCPESWWLRAKRPVASPLLKLCPNCHYTTHAAIDGLLRTPARDVSALPPRCVALARRGISIAHEQGLIPRPTLLAMAAQPMAG
jgi:hypothetical protein